VGDVSPQTIRATNFIYWLLLGCVLLFFREGNKADLWASHEARAAQNAQSLLDSGEWLLPRLFDGTPEYQKPPGYYWLVAVFGYLNGSEVSIWCVRLPSALAAMGTVFLLWNYLRKRRSIYVAMFVALVLATSVHFTGMARVGRIDMPLTFFVTALLLELRQRGSLWKIALCVTLIFLFKGPIGIVLVGAVVIGCWLCKIEFVSWKRMLLGGLIGLVIPVWWFVAVHLKTDGEFTQTFFVYHHFQRAAGGSNTLEHHPFWWYVPIFVTRFLPFSPLVVWVMIRLRQEKDAETRFGVVWFLAMFVLLSLSSFKRADYLLPAFPGAALALTGLIKRFFLRFYPKLDEPKVLPQQRRYWVIVGLWVAIASFGWVMFDRSVTFPKAQTHEVREFAKIVRERIPIGQTVTFFQVENHLLAYHLKAPIRTVLDRAEMEPLHPEYFVLPERVFDEVAQIWGLERITGTQDLLPVKAYHPVVLARWKSE